MAAWRCTPWSPTASEAAHMTAGPTTNRIAIDIIAIFVPQAIIRGWSAMNNPACMHYIYVHNKIDRTI